MIIDSDVIQTKEVLSWQGLHLLHFQTSSCSQKVRILLNELKLDWQAHPINLIKRENATTWFMGINPRGVVPVLVDNGKVYVESNDILRYLDDKYCPPNTSYFFDDDKELASKAELLLEQEGELHVALRLLTIVFGPLKAKDKDEIDNFEKNGPSDAKRDSEIEWWRKMSNKGISSQDITVACHQYFHAFTALDGILEDSEWLVGNKFSIVDIAWFTDLQRLTALGYPLTTHPNLYAYYNKLAKRPALLADSAKAGSRFGKLIFSLFKSVNRLFGKSIENYLP